MNTFSRISLFFLTITLCLAPWALFAENEEDCSISDTSSSPIQQWKKNIDTLNAVIRREAGKVTCSTDTSGTVSPAFVNYVNKVVPLNNSVSLMRDIYSLSSNGADFFSEVDSFLDPSWPVLELKPHLALIEQIERSIVETAQYVWSHCAQSLPLTTDILKDISGYNTEWRTISEVLIAMAKQTKEVKRFFQILSQWIQTEEYIDEVPFLIAPTGFSKDMYVYFSPTHIQTCRDKDPRKEAFWDVLKWAFTSWWKYPQAIKVWKDAMSLLLYRGGQIVGVSTYDANKESTINSIVQARKGGIGNSDIVINSQFFKEFGYRPNSKSVDEKIDTEERKDFYESIGYTFIRKVVPSLLKQWWEEGTSFVKNIQTQQELEKFERLEDLEESLYAQYRIGNIDLNKANDPQLASDLAQIIQTSKKQRKTLQATYKEVCTLLGKQAVNISGAWRCN